MTQSSLLFERKTPKILTVFFGAIQGIEAGVKPEYENWESKRQGEFPVHCSKV